MSKGNFAKAPIRIQIVGNNKRAIKSVLRENKSGRYIRVFDNYIAVSQANGYLLGEFICEKIKEKSFIYINLYTNNDVALVVVKNRKIVFDGVSGLETWKFDLLKYIDIKEYFLFVSESLADVAMQIFPDYISIITEENSFFDIDYLDKYRLISVRKYFNGSQHQNKFIYLILFGAIGIGGYYLYQRSMDVDIKKQDSFFQYRQEVKSNLAGPSIAKAVDVMIDINKNVLSWHINKCELTNNSLKVFIEPVSLSSGISEPLSYIEKHNLQYNPEGKLIVINIPLDKMGFDSNKIYTNINDLAVSFNDTLTKNTLYQVKPNVLTLKQNYKRMDLSISGNSVSIPELYFLTELMMNWPIFIDKATFVRTKDNLDLIYDAEIKIHLIGG